ncbi:energy transducer TonB [Christiangramia fulva]|uniref:Energy transducer TonB n=1 Tax=Christiangramia fulva TaxID=2126553 RepID=A0A2R3Z6U4_9FLAO|nr:energy transducer TonB [Christiangramia fulva]AVR45979.1 energy transducer TonB [Christiangramia fulva]
MVPKKNSRADLSRNSVIYFQIGLIIVLSISYAGLEWNFEHKQNYDLQQVEFTAENSIDVPVTELKQLPPPPPPPPAPEIIEVVQDNLEIKETEIKSTETSQDEKIEVAEVADIRDEEITEEIEDVPFVAIANVPLYPGCENEKDNEAKKKCMSKKIEDFVQREFRTEIGSELGLTGINKIYVVFRINEKGMVSNIQARGPHKALEAEAERVIKLLPPMIPGRQRNHPVGVIYTLPIIFDVKVAI